VTYLTQSDVAFVNFFPSSALLRPPSGRTYVRLASSISPSLAFLR